MLCDLRFFLLRIIYTNNDVNRTTLKEVLRFLSQNLSKISLRTIQKYCKKKIPDLPTRFCRPMKSETHIFLPYHPSPDHWLAQFSITSVHKGDRQHHHFHFNNFGIIWGPGWGEANSVFNSSYFSVIVKK